MTDQEPTPREDGRSKAAPRERSPERQVLERVIRADQGEALHGFALDCLSGIGVSGSGVMDPEDADALRHLLAKLGDGQHRDDEIVITMPAWELWTALELLRGHADRQASAPHVQLVQQTCAQLLSTIPMSSDEPRASRSRRTWETTSMDRSPRGGGREEA